MRSLLWWRRMRSSIPGGGWIELRTRPTANTIRTDKSASAFPEVMHRLRSRYNLYYPTPEGVPGSYGTIRVELTPEAQRLHPGARVYARRGYKLGARNFRTTTVPGIGAAFGERQAGVESLAPITVTGFTSTALGVVVAACVRHDFDGAERLRMLHVRRKLAVRNRRGVAKDRRSECVRTRKQARNPAEFAA